MRLGAAGRARNAARRALLALVLLLFPNLGRALEWTQEDGFRKAAVRLSSDAKVGFTLLAPETTGILFTNAVPPERHLTNQIVIDGSGVAAGDVDGDGWCDVFLCGMGGRSALYRNLGNWRFEEITSSAGLDLSQINATGAALGDLDGDGWLDLIVNTLGQGTRIFLNDGRGHFRLSPANPQVNQRKGATSLALADLDGDGWLDLYLVNYRADTIRDQPQPRFTVRPIQGEPQVVSINGRPVTDPEVVERFQFRLRPMSGGGATILHDEQGEVDGLFRNVGNGRLEAISWTNGVFVDEQGLALRFPPFDWGFSVMLRDLNADGAPDIYVCNDFSSPDRIWINDGRGHFHALPATGLRHTSLSTMAGDVADINRDGFDDIFTADMLSRESWRRLVQKNEANPNMPLFQDVTRRPQYPRNMLQLARGDGTWAEIAQLAGVEASEWSWTSMFLDVDLDGYEDLLVVNGFERDYMNMDAIRKIHEAQTRLGRALTLSDIASLNRLYPRLVTTNFAFRNLGGQRFDEVGAQWGFNLCAISQGMCAADLDNDGDLDLVINNCNSAASVLRNNATAARVAVRLKGRPPNTRGIGARIELRGGAAPIQSQEMICGGRYLSCDDAMRVFAAGPRPVSGARGGMRLEVVWRSGARSVIANAQPDHIYEVAEGGGGAPTGAEPASARRGAPAVAPYFRDVSALLQHSHAQEACDDFTRQPFLPRRLSTLGPGVSWFDVNGDGREDLLVGGGRGSAPALLLNEGPGRFARVTNLVFGAPLPESQTTVLGWRRPDGSPALLFGLSHWEDGETNAPAARQYLPKFSTALPGAASPTGLTNLIVENLPASPASTGPMALADVDGDGSLELFIGGRCWPGRWPEASPSLLLRRAGETWVIDARHAPALASAGLVSGALFTDLDGDGFPELVLACEWGPIRIFRNQHGSLREWPWSIASGADSPSMPLPGALEGLTGWWNGIAAGDFDGDGRMDLMASNWGRNTRYESFRARPLRLYHGNLNGDGNTIALDSWVDPLTGRYMPTLNIWTLSRSLPWLLSRFSSFESFGRAGLEDALGENLRACRYLEAAWLDSTLFLNRGDHFEVRPLPIEAQYTPAFAVCVADFDGDGKEDAFLSQNFFGVRPENSRYDAGRGLLLRGDGKGGFAAIPGQQSGLIVYGEQRGAAVCDYDGDGRADLAVAQSGDATKLFRNETAAAGLRVRLAGPTGNPCGVGALLRLQSGGQWGPAREVRAGSGYWSQDSATQVLSQREATAIRVRWPGGRTSESALPPACREVLVHAGGAVERLR